MQTRNDIYNSIEKKLGFKPEEYKPKYVGFECDNRISPFEKLNIQELNFLLDNHICDNKPIVSSRK